MERGREKKREREGEGEEGEGEKRRKRRRSGQERRWSKGGLDKSYLSRTLQ
jgi:hypothetical protein